MQVAQTPTWVYWVPVATALAGVVVGALLNWLQNIQRLKHEVKREDLRWAREKEQENNTRRFEERKSAYGNVLLRYSAWCDGLNAWGYHNFNNFEGKRPSAEQVNQLEEEASLARYAVELLGDQSVIDAARATHELAEEFTEDLKLWDELASGHKRKQGLEIRVTESLAALRVAARRDIEALLDQHGDSSTSTRPSGSPS